MERFHKHHTKAQRGSGFLVYSSASSTRSPCTEGRLVKGLSCTCRVPPGVFIKLHQATWHAGPFFSEGKHMDFYNLELADTNVADHHTHVYEGKITIEA